MKTETHDILRHWREAVPNDRLAHLVRDTERAFRRALQVRLAAHGVPFGHWSFLRILWETDGLTQKELSVRAGVMEVFAFQVDWGARLLAAHARCVVDRRGSADEVRQFVIEFGDELGVVLVSGVRVAQLLHGMGQGFADETAAILAEVATGVRLMVRLHGVFL